MQTTRQCTSLRASLLVATAGCLIAATAHAYGSRAVSIDADTRQAILDCTFEVSSSVQEASTRHLSGPNRTQVFAAESGGELVRIAGTASCFGDGQLITAAHVFDQVLGGRFEAPVVRDRRGREFPVDKIIRYSMRDDFVVFTAAGLPANNARPHASSADTSGELYFASRRSDGDITFSKTMYRGRSKLEVLGREGWLEFGPAPGHGASGAALLDATGRVIGLINGRASEDADASGFAVPIEQVEAASTEWAVIAMRDPLRILNMPSERNQPLVGGIPLPAPYAKFEKHMIDVRRTYFAHMLPYSLSLAGADAPMSDAQRTQLCAALGVGYCGGANGDASAVTPVRAEKISRGCSAAWSGVGAALVQCASSRASLVPAAFGRRFAAPPPAPCTNDDELGDVSATDSFTDHTGAQWTVRAHPMHGCDWVVLSMSRTAANGTLTLMRGAPSAYAEPAVMQLKALTSVGCEGCKGPAAEEGAVLAEVRNVQDEVKR